MDVRGEDLPALGLEAGSADHLDVLADAGDEVDAVAFQLPDRLGALGFDRIHHPLCKTEELLVR
jgi:hypothetical protein